MLVVSCSWLITLLLVTLLLESHAAAAFSSFPSQSLVAETGGRLTVGRQTATTRPSALWMNQNTPDFTVLDDDDNEEEFHSETRESDVEGAASRSSGLSGSAFVGRKQENNVAPSWMQRNDDFMSEGSDREEARSFQRERNDKERRSGGGGRNRRRNNNNNGGNRSSNNNNNKSFRDDFRGSRVFVQGIPPTASWQDLKDHFRLAGDVVFASVSVDPQTGESKGHGIVQFETTEMALTAIAIMREHPLDGHTLFVREDVKEGHEGATLRRNNNLTRDSQSHSSSAWSCADEDSASYLSDSDRTEVLSMIRARNDARRRRNYNVSDNLREELKFKFGVHIDDRLKLWWVSLDDAVPQAIRDVHGPGRWGPKPQPEPWRQIPTTPENDACVNPDLVKGLLAQRDIARREKDFVTADALLAQARDAPDGDLSLRIHDESRTWRVWTEAPPPKPVAPHLEPGERCIALVQEHAPEKVAEIETLLKSFPGREYKILKKLRQRYEQR